VAKGAASAAVSGARGRGWLALLGFFGLAFPGFAEEAVNRLLLVNCQIITLAQGQEDPFVGYIVVDEGGKISKVGRGAAPASIEAAEVFDAAGQVAMPGFVSARTRLAESVARGGAPNETAAEADSAGPSLLRGDRIQKGDLYVYTLYGALDLLRGGVTTVYNDTTGSGSLPTALYLEQLDAEFDAGGHFVFGYQADPAGGPGRMRAGFRSYLDRAAGHAPSGLLLRSSMAGLALRGAEAGFKAEAEALQAFPEFARDLQVRCLEHQPPATSTAEERSNFGWLGRYGLLGPNLTYAEFLYPTDEILAQSVAAGVSLVWSPMSDGRLGLGLADVPRYLRMGLTVGLGIDSLAGAGIADPFENMRMGLYGIRFRDSDPRGLQPLAMLRMHTIGAARAIHVADRVGTLEPGKYGDIVLVDPHWPDTGPVLDLYATLVLACDRLNISNVFVAGKPVVRQGRHAWLDLPGVSREARRRAEPRQAASPP